MQPGNARAKECLEENREKDGFSAQCKTEVEKMMAERAADFRLDAKLRKLCAGDIADMCGYERDSLDAIAGYDARVIQCLQDYRFVDLLSRRPLFRPLPAELKLQHPTPTTLLAERWLRRQCTLARKQRVPHGLGIKCETMCTLDQHDSMENLLTSAFGTPAFLRVGRRHVHLAGGLLTNCWLCAGRRSATLAARRVC